MTFVIWSKFVLIIKNGLDIDNNKNINSTLESVLRETIWRKIMV